MRELLDDIDRAVENGVFYLALMGALTVPDMCAALAAKNGRTDQTKFKSWVRDHMTHDERQGMTAVEMYRFRCSMVHQGSAFHDKAAGRVLFLEPGQDAVQLRDVRMGGPGIDAHVLDLGEFCQAMTAAARRWLDANADNDRVRMNLERFIRRHPNGVRPFIGGAVVIG